MGDNSNKFGFFGKIKNLAAVGTANLVANGISSVFWLYLAALLGKENYGELGYLIAIIGIASAIASLGSKDTLIVYGSKEINIQATVFFIILIASSVTAIVLFVILDDILVSVYPIGFVIFSAITYEVLGRKLYVHFAIYTIVQRVIMVVLALVFYYMIGLNGIIFGYALSYLVFSFALYKIFKEGKIDFALLKPKLGFMMNDYMGYLVRVFGISIDKIIIFPIFGAAALGVYQLGFQIYLLTMLLPNIVFQYVLPLDSVGVDNKKLKKYTIVASCIITIVTIVVSPIVIPLLFDDFQESILLVQVISLGLVPATLSLIYNAEFFAREKSKIVFICSSISVIVLIISIILLGNYIGVVGFAVALVISRFVEFILLYGIKKTSFEKQSHEL